MGNESEDAIKKNEARAMADFIEGWLGNRLVRKTLKFCARRDGCGRRMENSLKGFVGERPDLCIRCKTSSFIVKNFMNAVLGKAGSGNENVKAYLKDPMWRKGLSSVLEGIAEWGPKKPFTSYSPFLVVWNITRQCNLRCRHCYSAAGSKEKKELGTGEALDAVDKMADTGVAYVALSGGEPLARQDLFRIIERINERGMAFSIATNGTLLTREKARLLKEAGCLYIQVSLDGANPETHNSFRGTDSFKEAVQGARNAVEEGIHVGIATTVTQHNYGEVPNIIDLSERIGAKTFMHYNFIPTGRGRDIRSLDISPEQREELLKMLASEAGKREMSILSTACQYGRVCVEGHAAHLSMTHFDAGKMEKDNPLASLAEFIGGCGTGRLYCSIEHDGTITPCTFIPISLGNIKKDRLLDVWLNSKTFRKIREREKFFGNCGACSHRNICGGCRARAFSYFGDLQAPDPGCINNKKWWNKLKE